MIMRNYRYSKIEYLQMVRLYAVSSDNLRGARRLYAAPNNLKMLRNRGVINPQVPGLQFQRTTARLLVMFVLFNLFSYSRAFRAVKDMNWTTDPSTAWPESNRYSQRIVILLLDVPNYLDNDLEKIFIATGVLLDNSRILTSYNPFRKLIGSSNLTDNILALFVTGMEKGVLQVGITNIVCGRQIAYVPDDENSTWHHFPHSPLHDLMVMRMDEEIGIARLSNKSLDTPHAYFFWGGELDAYKNALISFPASPDDEIDPTNVRIISIGCRNKAEMRDYDTIFQIDYEEDDALADCDEWLPRNWGFFICIRNIDNWAGLGSGAMLYSGNKLFGVGSFALFVNDTGVLIFTDVRYYEELIMKTCGDEEFPEEEATTAGP